MTPIVTPVVTDASTQRRIRRRLLAVGVAIGAFFTLAAAGGIYAWAESRRVIEPAMHKACRWPVAEGQMTVVTILNAKLVCWEWK